MLLLSDCVLTIDGERIALSNPMPLASRPSLNGRMVFGFSSRDGERLARLEGRTGIVHTRAGVVLFRLKLLSVDAALNTLNAEPARAERSSASQPER